MKKSLIRGFILFILLLAPLPINAATTAEFTGVILTKKDDEITYNLRINSDEKIDIFESELEYDEEVLELVSITGNSNWEKQSSQKIISFKSKIDYSTFNQTADGKLVTSTSSTIAKIVFKVKKDATTTIVKIKDMTANNQDEASVSITNAEITKNITVKSSDNTLKKLEINSESVPEFDPEKIEYTIEVVADIDKVTITAVKNANEAEFTSGFGSRTETLNYGENEILVKVKSEAGTTRTYTIKINREDNRNSNCDLKNIVINTGTIPIQFNSKIYEYTFNTYKLNKVEVTAEPYDTKSEVKIVYPKSFVVGENIVTITVTSESGTTKNYKLFFVNSDTLVSTDLKSLVINGYSLEFDKNTTAYTIVYNSKYSSTTLTATSEANNNEVLITVDGKETKSGSPITININPGSSIKVRINPLVEDSTSLTKEYTIMVIEDTTINFYLILEAFMSIILIVAIIITIVKRNKIIKKLKQV